MRLVARRLGKTLIDALSMKQLLRCHSHWAGQEELSAERSIDLVTRSSERIVRRDAVVVTQAATPALRISRKRSAQFPHDVRFELIGYFLSRTHFRYSEGEHPNLFRKFRLNVAMLSKPQPNAIELIGSLLKRTCFSASPQRDMIIRS